MWEVFIYFFSITHTGPLCQTVTLSVLRTVPPVRACLRPETEPCVVENGFCGGSEGFRRKKNSLPLHTSMHTAQILFVCADFLSLPA